MENPPEEEPQPTNHETLAVARRINNLTRFEKAFLCSLLDDQLPEWGIVRLNALAPSAWDKLVELCEGCTEEIRSELHDNDFQAGKEFYLIAPPHMLALNEHGFFELREGTPPCPDSTQPEPEHEHEPEHEGSTSSSEREAQPPPPA